MPVLIHARKKPFCARDIDAYFGALPPALPLPPLSPSAEAAAVAAPDHRRGVFSAVGDLVGRSSTTSDDDSPGSTTPPGRELGLVVIGDRLLTDVVLTSQLARPREDPPAVVSAGLAPRSSSPLTTPSATLTPVGATGTAPTLSLVQRQAPYNLSLLTTALHVKADVRQLRLLERLLESLARRRLGRPLSTDLAAWRSLGVVKPEPAPLTPPPLEGWRRALSLAGRGFGWSAGELAKGVKIGTIWIGAQIKQAWVDRQARKAEEADRAQEEREVRAKAEVALDRLVKEDVEQAHAFRVASAVEDGERTVDHTRETAPVMPQKEAEVAAIKA